MNMAREKRYGGKWLMLSMGEAMWAHFYHRVIDHLGGITHRLVDQKELARLAEPFYNRFARGGEGHLEVGKNVYYTVHHLAHMVLALKPFGCMPSSQSDGVQSAVINKFRDMIFLPIETSGEGEVNAHSRVQMALGEAKAKAKGEFETVLKSTGKRLEDILPEERMRLGEGRQWQLVQLATVRLGLADEAADGAVRVAECRSSPHEIVREIRGHHRARNGGLHALSAELRLGERAPKRG